MKQSNIVRNLTKTLKMVLLKKIRIEDWLYLYMYVSESLSVVSNSLWPHGLYHPWNSPGQNTGVGSLALFQGIFPTQGLNPGLPHCRRLLYQLSHQGSPRMLECVACPFSIRSSDPGIECGLLHCRQILYQLSYQGSPNLGQFCRSFPGSELHKWLG